jgi:hypothetical protein
MVPVGGWSHAGSNSAAPAPAATCKPLAFSCSRAGQRCCAAGARSRPGACEFFF